MKSNETAHRMGLTKYRMAVEYVVREIHLATSPADPKTYTEFGPGKNAPSDAKLQEELATLPGGGVFTRHRLSKLPDAPDLEEQVADLGADAVIEAGTTVFHRDADGRPFLFAYQIRGHFKDTCAALGRLKGDKDLRIEPSLSSEVKAYKKVIDGLIFVEPKCIPITLPDGEKIGICERPIRIAGPQGERTALARSETVPVGSKYQFAIILTDPGHMDLVAEWLTHGKYRGMGQWRNSGKGSFDATVLKITRFTEPSIPLPEITEAEA